MPNALQCPMVFTQNRKHPGMEAWKPFEGEEYVVFIDESFYKFFDFANEDGNFVHGAVGLPTSRYGEFRRSLASAAHEYFEAFQRLKGTRPKEIKSADLYKVDFAERRRVVLKIRAAMEANGGFIAGFYTGNRGYVMEAIRLDLIHEDGIFAVPDDHTNLYAAKAKTLNLESIGPGQSALISKLLFLPVLAVSYFLTKLGSSFRVVYDPRQKDEDNAVKGSVEGLMASLKNLDKIGIKSRFMGLESSKASHEEFGLQIADLVAGEVRRFFRFNPDLLTCGSDLTLLKFEHQEGETALLGELDGKLYKKGRKLPIPPAVLKKALQPTADCLLPYLRKSLAAGLVTCITEHGIERDVALFDNCFLDICD